MSESNEQKARKWLDAQHVPGRSADKTFCSISADELAKLIAPLFEAGPGGEATPPDDKVRSQCWKCHRPVFWHGDTWYHEYSEDLMICGAAEAGEPPICPTCKSGFREKRFYAFIQCEKDANPHYCSNAPCNDPWHVVNPGSGRTEK